MNTITFEKNLAEQGYISGCELAINAVSKGILPSFRVWSSEQTS